jgi:hypothetical protein
MDINLFVNSSFTLDVILRIFLFFCITRNVEFFLLLAQYEKGGLLSWEILKLRNLNPATKITWWFNVFGNRNIYLFVQLSSFIFSLLLLLKFIPFSYWSFLPIFLCNLIIQYRDWMSCDGADGVANITNVSMMLYLLLPHSKIVEYTTLTFLSTQVMISYFFSGLYKIRSKKWMTGEALQSIMATDLFGNKKINTLLKRNPLIGKTLTIGVSFFLLFYPLSILLPFKFFIIYLVAGLLFHLTIAAIMGINRFWQIYLANYPALIFIKFWLMSVV